MKFAGSSLLTLSTSLLLMLHSADAQSAFYFTEWRPRVYKDQTVIELNLCCQCESVLLIGNGTFNLPSRVTEEWQYVVAEFKAGLEGLIGPEGSETEVFFIFRGLRLVMYALVSSGPGRVSGILLDGGTFAENLSTEEIIRRFDTGSARSRATKTDLNPDLDRLELKIQVLINADKTRIVKMLLDTSCASPGVCKPRSPKLFVRIKGQRLDGPWERYDGKMPDAMEIAVKRSKKIKDFDGFGRWVGVGFDMVFNHFRSRDAVMIPFNDGRTKVFYEYK